MNKTLTSIVMASALALPAYADGPSFNKEAQKKPQVALSTETKRGISMYVGSMPGSKNTQLQYHSYSGYNTSTLTVAELKSDGSTFYTSYTVDDKEIIKYVSIMQQNKDDMFVKDVNFENDGNPVTKPLIVTEQKKYQQYMKNLDLAVKQYYTSAVKTK